MQVCDDAYQWRSILSLVSCDAGVPNKERIPLPEPRPPEARGGPEREPDRGQRNVVCTSPLLVHTQMILLLNKCDIPDSNDRCGTRIKDSLPSFGDQENDLPTATRCSFCFSFCFVPFLLCLFALLLSALFV